MRSSPHADPARGVFETLLVLDGRPVELDAHVERLAASVSALFGVELPDSPRRAIVQGARRIRDGKLRLTVIPKTGGPETEVSTAKIDAAEALVPPQGGIALRSFVVEGGLGAHKWADRRLVDGFAATIDKAEVPLLLDSDGEVLEASRANVFAVRAGTVFTPPTDGRIVPGIARASTVELARASGLEVREEPLSLNDLLAADEVFLTNSVRGIEPVSAIDGRDVPSVSHPYGGLIHGTSPGAELATALRRRWLTVPQGESVAVAAGGQRAGRPER